MHDGRVALVVDAMFDEAERSGVLLAAVAAVDLNVLGIGVLAFSVLSWLAARLVERVRRDGDPMPVRG
ncbi:hypothetical protein [Kocuria oceani]|uniref:Uncharacterized protein n=1 Tax=Kocuria oceani TaxID=988827 RepID=A0ABV9TIC6_9MICC|nr:hypothetical protein [Kocuria oceani]